MSGIELVKGNGQPQKDAKQWGSLLDGDLWPGCGEGAAKQDQELGLAMTEENKPSQAGECGWRRSGGYPKGSQPTVTV